MATDLNKLFVEKEGNYSGQCLREMGPLENSGSPEWDLIDDGKTKNSNNKNQNKLSENDIDGLYFSSVDSFLETIKGQSGNQHLPEITLTFQKSIEKSLEKKSKDELKKLIMQILKLVMQILKLQEKSFSKLHTEQKAAVNNSPASKISTRAGKTTYCTDATGVAASGCETNKKHKKERKCKVISNENAQPVGHKRDLGDTSAASSGEKTSLASDGCDDSAILESGIVEEDVNNKKSTGYFLSEECSTFSKHLSEQPVKPLKKRPGLRIKLEGHIIQDTFPVPVNSSESVHGKSNRTKIKFQKQGRRPKAFVCKLCNKTFHTKQTYRSHLRGHVDSFECSICCKIFKSRGSLYHHQRGVHSQQKPYRCNFCDMTFGFHHSYSLHLQKHTGERPYKCKLCSKTYLTSNHLKEHMQAIHSENSIVCHVCGKTFSYINALKVHLDSHSGEKHSCSTCSKSFNSKHALNRHLACHLPYQCKLCGKYFKSEYSCTLHTTKLHSKVQNKQFACEICGKSFVFKCILVKHAQTHNELRTFLCKICGKVFKSKASLYTHKYVHTEGKAYNCTICSKAFKTKNCLVAHIKRHQNCSSHTCPICHKTFQDKGGLTKHTKTVHLPRKFFSCKICQKTGTRADNMKTHVKSHRKEVGPSDNPADFVLAHTEQLSETFVSKGSGGNGKQPTVSVGHLNNTTTMFAHDTKSMALYSDSSSLAHNEFNPLSINMPSEASPRNSFTAVKMKTSQVSQLAKDPFSLPSMEEGNCLSSSSHQTSHTQSQVLGNRFHEDVCLPLTSAPVLMSPFALQSQPIAGSPSTNWAQRFDS